MSVIIPINLIERKPNSNKYRIVGKGVTVEFLAQFIDDPEWPVRRICENYDLTPAEIYAAWAFYYDHKEEIDRNIAAAAEMPENSTDDAKRERMMRRYAAKPDSE